MIIFDPKAQRYPDDCDAVNLADKDEYLKAVDLFEEYFERIFPNDDFEMPTEDNE